MKSEEWECVDDRLPLICVSVRYKRMRISTVHTLANPSHVHHENLTLLSHKFSRQLQSTSQGVTTRHLRLFLTALAPAQIVQQDASGHRYIQGVHHMTL
jgi:hypothetical protein